MKSFKFLAALAIPAMFAACTNEEIVMDTPQQMQDIAGAELIATGMSLNVTDGGVSSRLDASGWKDGDQLALGWAVVGGYNSIQTIKGELGEELIANHLFERESGTFVTKGNIYKGWHFAYWPFEYMEMIGKKVFDINPEQNEEWGKDRYANKLKLTARHFLTSEDLDEEYQLKPNREFYPTNVVNEIAVRTVPNGGFVDNTVLNALRFEEMTISTNSKKVFTKYATLVPNNIPDAKNAKGNSIYTSTKLEDKVYDRDNTELAVKNAIESALYSSDKSGKTTTKSSNITTYIKANLVTGTETTLRAFSLPVSRQENLKINEIKIKVQNGFFRIKEDKNAAAGSLAEANNQALTTLAEAYLENGKMTELGTGVVGIVVNLYPEIFTPDFSDIDDYPEWKHAVDLVDALGTYNEENVPEFTITGNIEVDDKTIKMPANCGVVVKGDYDIVTKATMSTWPEDLDASAVDVIIDSNVTLPVPSAVKANSITVNTGKKLTLNGGKITTEKLDVTVINNGTIVVKKNAKVENVENNARIEVVYGSYVTTTDIKGTVAYVLTGSDKAYQINYLIDTENNNAGYASVNTLVVNSGKTLNLGLTDPAGTGLDDPYNPTTGTEAIPLADLSNINVEMNGGSIVGVHAGKQSVGAVSVLKGTNTITDVIPASIEIAAKATLNIDATKDVYGVKYLLDMPATQINNAGTLNVEANTHIDVLINTGTVDATGYKLHSYTESNTQAGKTIGDVKLCDENPEVDMSQYGSAIKDALDTFNADNNNALSTYETLVQKLNAIAVDLEKATTEKWASLSIYEAILAYYEAAEMDVPSTFTALTIAKIEGATGVEFGLQ